MEENGIHEAVTIGEMLVYRNELYINDIQSFV